MELARLIEALSGPAAYPHPVEAVEVRQTHISAVFLAGPFAYKVKKPVAPGFLDFSTLAKRRHFCEEEVRLNRRLAPTVYLDVVPVTQTGGGLKVEGPGEAVEWAVKMQRLPEEATLQRRLLAGKVGAAEAETLARRIADFHARAETSDRIAALGRFDVVSRTLRDNFEPVKPGSQAGAWEPGFAGAWERGSAVLGRVRQLIEEALNQLRPLIEERARRGVPRDAHGDLHLDHVYLFPERPPPADLVVVDCIEFNERFRYIDPVADMAFLVMDFAFHGRRDLGRLFAEAYFRETGDGEGRALLTLYTAYRAAVRGKVEGMKAAEPEVPEAERAAAAAKSRAYWLLALAELELPGRRPGLVLVGGLPGTGKSTLTRAVAERAGFDVIRSDVVRKELAGLAPEEPGRSDGGGDIYTPEWTERTYAECLRRAERALGEGRRVLVDATFREERRRRMFLEAAGRLGAPVVLLVCRADPETVRRRLDARRDDVSDADWTVYRLTAEQWEEAGPHTRQVLREVATDGPPEGGVERALDALREFGLSD